MTNEYDRWVATGLLVCAGKMHGMTTMRARQLLQDLEERLDKWDASRSAAEVFVSQRLDHRIENLEARVKALMEQIQVASIRWTPERVGDLENERIFLQESLENVKKLKVSSLLLQRHLKWNNQHHFIMMPIECNVLPFTTA